MSAFHKHHKRGDEMARILRGNERVLTRGGVLISFKLKSFPINVNERECRNTFVLSNFLLLGDVVCIKEHFVQNPNSEIKGSRTEVAWLYEATSPFKKTLSLHYTAAGTCAYSALPAQAMQCSV